MKSERYIRQEFLNNISTQAQKILRESSVLVTFDSIEINHNKTCPICWKSIELNVCFVHYIF